MLTQKEFKFLSLLFKFLEGKHLDYVELKRYIKDRFHLSDKISFEMAYLYDENWKEEGFSQNQENLKRMSYEDYMDNIPEEVKMVMEITEDNDPEKYDYDGYSEVSHEGITYRIYEDDDDFEDAVNDNLDYLCDDPEDRAGNYITMDDSDRRDFADDEAQSRIDNMSHDEILIQSGKKSEYDSFEDLKSELEEIESEIKEKRDKLEKLTNQLDNVEDKESLEEQIYDLENDIEDLESRVEDIGDIERKKEDFIQEVSEELKESFSSDIYDEMEDLVEYFVGNGYYRSVRELVRRGPVELDCYQLKKDYLSDLTYDDMASNLGYNHHKEVRRHHIVWG